MLVLGRRVGEEILIGDDVRLVVVGIRGSQVRLGFEAPPEVSIQRDELRDRSAEFEQSKLLTTAESSC